MGIAPTCPKAAEARPERAGPLPGRSGSLQPERTVRKVDRRIGLIGMQTGHQLAMLQLQQDFAQPRNARRRFQVTNVGFDRPDRAMAGLHLGIPRKGQLQAIHFNRVAEGGSCAMGFQVGQVMGIKLGPFQRQAHHLGLGLGIGHGVAIGFAPVIHGTAPDHGLDRVSIAQGRRQGLQNHRAHPFAGHIAIATGPKTAAFPIG